MLQPQTQSIEPGRSVKLLRKNGFDVKTKEQFDEASEAQSRTTDQVNIPIGSWVYVFRDSPSYKGWVGPGVTIAEDPSGKSTWISMRGRLWKASKEQLRLATPEEELGAELIVELSKEMLSKLHKPGHVVFQDVSAEGGPTDEYFDEVMRTLNIREDRPESQQRQRPGQADETMSSSTSSPLSKLQRTHRQQQSLARLKRAQIQLLRLVLSKPVAVLGLCQKQLMALHLCR